MKTTSPKVFDLTLLTRSPYGAARFVAQNLKSFVQRTLRHSVSLGFAYVGRTSARRVSCEGPPDKPYDVRLNRGHVHRKNLQRFLRQNCSLNETWKVSFNEFRALWFHLVLPMSGGPQRDVMSCEGPPDGPNDAF